MIGEELRHAALARARQHEKRLVVEARHDDVARAGIGIDQAEPAAPGRRLAAAAGEAARHRMALAALGDLRLEAAFDDLAGGSGRR